MLKSFLKKIKARLQFSDATVASLTLLETDHQLDTLVNAEMSWQSAGAGKKQSGEAKLSCG